ncbi:MAG: 4Fe-4S binding protein [Promethearchaeota archaeon]
MNDDELYEKLREHLDGLPVGMPATESRVEIRLLKMVFSPVEARLATFLGLTPEPAKRIWRRVRRAKDASLPATEQEVGAALEAMWRKGLINGGKDKNTGEWYFASAPLAIGIFEYQLNRLTKEFAEAFEQYVHEAFAGEILGVKTPQLRTIPVEEAIPDDRFVMNYDQLRHIIETRSPISLAECVCRQTKRVLGGSCEHPEEFRETCFQFGAAAHSYVEQGQARFVTKEEALEVLRRAQEEGLVIQPSNSQRPFCICCCCGCCCEVLTNAKRYDKPARFFATNHFSEVDPDLCAACGTCVERCPMGAATLDDDVAKIDVDRCIGCGVCIPTCSAGAITLKKRGEELVPPADTVEMYTRMMEEKAARQRGGGPAA